MVMHTHYDNLQIDPNATDAEIKAAYRRLSSQYHPDRNPDPESKHIMQLINRAYE
ncbi:MAG: J domain-containing protein, partial [Neisseriaceae bacterium]|nr:J domain-containing protein [Neisseriaceae bacterium]